jgi:hypothetical protein
LRGSSSALPNGDLLNARVARKTPISDANVSKLGVARRRR